MSISTKPTTSNGTTYRKIGTSASLYAEVMMARVPLSRCCTKSGVMRFMLMLSTCGSLAAKSAVRRDVNSAPTSDAPSVEPICRKKLFAAVAVPTMACGNSFCTMSTRICWPRPMPKPSTNRNTPVTTSGVPTVSCDSSTNPTAVTAHDAMGIHL